MEMKSFKFHVLRQQEAEVWCKKSKIYVFLQKCKKDYLFSSSLKRTFMPFGMKSRVTILRRLNPDIKCIQRFCQVHFSTYRYL